MRVCWPVGTQSRTAGKLCREHTISWLGRPPATLSFRAVYRLTKAAFCLTPVRRLEEVEGIFSRSLFCRERKFEFSCNLGRAPPSYDGVNDALFGIAYIL